MALFFFSQSLRLHGSKGTIEVVPLPQALFSIVIKSSSPSLQARTGKKSSAPERQSQSQSHSTWPGPIQSLVLEGDEGKGETGLLLESD